jgi:hypothetical protein
MKGIIMNRDQELLLFFKKRCDQRVGKLTNNIIKKISYSNLSEFINLRQCQISMVKKGNTKKLICNLPVIERMASHLGETPAQFINSFYKEDNGK